MEHISNLVAALPPDADDCRTDSDASECTISEARRIITNIVARYGGGQPMKVRISDGDIVYGRTETTALLVELGDLDPAQQWLLETGDGHINPVVRIAPIQNRQSGKYVVGIVFDSMIDCGGEE